MISKESFNGESGDEVYFSISDKTLQTAFHWTKPWDALQSNYAKQIITNIYQPFCLSVLHKLLRINKDHVMRKGKVECAYYISYTSYTTFMG